MYGGGNDSSPGGYAPDSRMASPYQSPYNAPMSDSRLAQNAAYANSPGYDSPGLPFASGGFENFAAGGALTSGGFENFAAGGASGGFENFAAGFAGGAQSAPEYSRASAGAGGAQSAPEYGNNGNGNGGGGKKGDRGNKGVQKGGSKGGKGGDNKGFDKSWGGNKGFDKNQGPYQWNNHGGKDDKGNGFGGNKGYDNKGSWDKSGMKGKGKSPSHNKSGPGLNVNLDIVQRTSDGDTAWLGEEVDGVMQQGRNSGSTPVYKPQDAPES